MLPDKQNGGATDQLLSFILTYGIILTGLFLIGLSIIGTDEKWPIWLVAFLRDIGLLFAAATGATLLHEKLLREEAQKRVIAKLEEMLEANIPKLSKIASTTADAIHERFSKDPPKMAGLRLLCNIRRSSADYYRWTIERSAQTLFFAGRSILHRIDADVRSQTGGSAEDALFRCLTEGSKITILFLDPRIDVLRRLADEERQQPNSMLGNIAISLGISQRLVNRLKREHSKLPQGAHLTIQIYDRIPYFAFHKQNEQMIIGFYFLSMEGSSSAAYEVVDDETKNAFDAHFLRIRSDPSAPTLVDFDSARGGDSFFNDQLFAELSTFLKKKLPGRGEELLRGGATGFRISPSRITPRSER